ncbi:hypothetical protein AA0X95_14240 [Bacillus sp. 1P10SD]|uniref:hypothetical protein n=1 Tax=Bacillus sp. 1P10SD TaxID=3132265 RepID=UPI0039A3FEA3
MIKPKLWTKNFISSAIANFLTFTTFYFLLVSVARYGLQELNSNASEVGFIVTFF